jgi:hypothetical protein
MVTDVLFTSNNYFHVLAVWWKETTVRQQCNIVNIVTNHNIHWSLLLPLHFTATAFFWLQHRSFCLPILKLVSEMVKIKGVSIYKLAKRAQNENTSRRSVIASVARPFRCLLVRANIRVDTFCSIRRRARSPCIVFLIICLLF